MMELDLNKQSLLEWMRENRIDDDLFYKENAVDQMCFYMDHVHPLVINADRYDERSPPWVVSTHRSKSVKLPVYYSEGSALKIIARDNFYNWKVSVMMEKGEAVITSDMLGLLNNPNEHVSSVYCEGFKKDWVFGSVMANKRRFTVELSRFHELWAFMYLLKNQVCC